MKSYAAAFWGKVFGLAFLIGLWPLVFAAGSVTVNGVLHPGWSGAAFGFAVFVVFFIGFFAWPFYILNGYLLLRLYTKIAGRAWLSNRHVRAVWPELEGYKLFLETVDADNIQFESANVKLGIVTKTLPYAMVFNLETQWQQRLKHDK